MCSSSSVTALPIVLAWRFQETCGFHLPCARKSRRPSVWRIPYSIAAASDARNFRHSLANAFGKVRVPVALCEVRWLSKLNCLEIFAHPATAQALREYIVAKPPDRQSSGERHLLNVLEDRMDEVRDILRILRPMGVLTANLQKRSLDLPGALLLLNETKAKLTEMTALSDELASLRDDLLGYLGNQIPVQESTWLSKIGRCLPRCGGAAEVLITTEKATTLEMGGQS